MLKFLMIGAHPDDTDLLCGGLAMKLRASGHEAVFLSLTSGNAGHQTMDRAALRERRLEEMKAAAACYGIRYETLDLEDGSLTADLPTREKLLRFIRRERPDVVITHRTCDYHPDHRACGQLVNDCSYLVCVPLVCPDAPVPARPPVILSFYDRFTVPAPIRPDVAVPIDAFAERKIHGVLAHKSQFYEWLPFINGWQEVLTCQSEEEATQRLTQRLRERFAGPVRQFPDRFPTGAVCGEVFQIDEYGSPMTDEIRAAMEG